MHGSNQVDLNWVIKKVANFVLKPFMKWVPNGLYNIYLYVHCKYRKSQLGEDHKRIDGDVLFALKFQQKGINSYILIIATSLSYHNEAFLLKRDKNS